MAYERAGRRRFGLPISVIGALFTVALLAAPASLTLADAGGSSAAAPPYGAVTRPQAVQLGSSAPDVTLESIDGEMLRLSDLEGDKNVVLVFFRGTW
jgi:hypothetical protein